MVFIILEKNMAQKNYIFYQNFFYSKWILKEYQKKKKKTFCIVKKIFERKEKKEKFFGKKKCPLEGFLGF